jgi:fructose-1,6-bisphosphatase
MAHIRGGIVGLAWMAAYFGTGLMMLNAIRACLRYGAISSVDQLESSAS